MLGSNAAYFLRLVYYFLSLLMKKAVRIMKPSKEFEKANKGKEKYLILEVGNYNTKMIEVTPLVGRMLVHKGFIIATPEGTLEDDVVVKPDELVSLLSEKIKEEKITSRNVTISLSSGDIITREMPIPKMSKRDTLSFIKNNSKDLFPVDLDEYTLGYVSMGSDDKSKLLIIAIPNDIIVPYIEIMEKLGLVLKSINFSGFELYNLIDFEIGSDSGTYAVIDLGSKNTNFIIVSKGMLMYNRVLKTGSDDITKEIAERFKCTLTKAEKIKRDYNSVIMEGSLKETDDVYIVANIIQEVLRGMLGDVSNIIEYYNGNHTRSTVSKVYIIGLATKISGISEFVESTLGIETEKIKEFDRIMFEEAAKPAKRRQVTLENCLGAVPVDDKKVNLIKSKLQLSKVYQSIDPIVYQIGALVGILMILVLCVINFLTYGIKKEITVFEDYIASKQSLIDLQDEHSDKLAEINNMKNLINEVPDGVEKAAKTLEYIEMAVEAIPGITVTGCTVSSVNTVNLSFLTVENSAVFDFDKELRNYFDFEKKFYPSSKSEFTLALKLREDI